MCVCVCCVCILHSEKQLLLPILVCGCVRNLKKHLPAPITVCLENLIVSTKHTHMHLLYCPWPTYVKTFAHADQWIIHTSYGTMHSVVVPVCIITVYI